VNSVLVNRALFAAACEFSIACLRHCVVYSGRPVESFRVKVLKELIELFLVGIGFHLLVDCNGVCEVVREVLFGAVNRSLIA
jgi:hypothetical protein